MTSEEILDHYDRQYQEIEQFRLALTQLVTRLIELSGINLHSIDSRLKTRESLEGKLKLKDSYSSLEEVTDIVGVRVITYFSDDVDAIADVIEREFEVDRGNSVDKRASLEPDRFGYLSLHYVIKLNKERADLPEYKRFSGICAEIQVRSILQHAWAEIEHDIGYKSEVEVPKTVRRSFSRLASLLELADKEFEEIRERLEHYRIDVEQRAQTAPNEVYLDLISLREFIDTDGTVQELDSRIIEITGFELTQPTEMGLSGHLEHSVPFNITTLKDLEVALQENYHSILARARDIGRKKGDVSKGISIFYLHQILAGKLGLEGAEKYLEKMRIGSDPKAFAAYLVALVDA